MGLLGTGADLASDLLILFEVVITILIFVGIRSIRRGRRVARHRSLMLWTLGLNALFLVGFLVQDALKTESVLSRGIGIPALVFYPLLVVHILIAVTAFGIAVAAWRIARRGVVETAHGMDLAPDVRRRHLRVSRWYPWMWGLTLVTGFLVYGLLYVRP